MHKKILLLALCFSQFGCTHTKPRSDINDACSLFSEKFEWYRYHHKAKERYDIPIWMQLAFVHMESKFDGFARPIKEKRGFFIKTWSSALGYAQALDASWQEYVKHRPSWWRSRSHYADSVDFMGWYLNRCHKHNGISKRDPYNMYLCYHEGITGYKKGSYKKKKAIIQYAKNTDILARKYYQQLKKCEKELRWKHAYFL